MKGEEKFLPTCVHCHVAKSTQGLLTDGQCSLDERQGLLVTALSM
jgi:hypothetical protein